MASVFGKAVSVRVRDEIYVAAVPLRAAKGPPHLLMSTAFSFNLWDFNHFLVIIKPSSQSQVQAVVFDFQPKDPENVYAALAVLSGSTVPGVVRKRKLTKLPRSKCWFVGASEVGAVDIALQFNDGWETDLRVGRHDCRDYTNGLVESLTGEKCVLERLRGKVT